MFEFREASFRLSFTSPDHPTARLQDPPIPPPLPLRVVEQTVYIEALEHQPGAFPHS